MAYFESVIAIRQQAGHSLIRDTTHFTNVLARVNSFKWVKAKAVFWPWHIVPLPTKIRLTKSTTNVNIGFRSNFRSASVVNQITLWFSIFFLSSPTEVVSVRSIAPLKKPLDFNQTYFELVNRGVRSVSEGVSPWLILPTQFRNNRILTGQAHRCNDTFGRPFIALRLRRSNRFSPKHFNA